MMEAVMIERPIQTETQIDEADHWEPVLPDDSMDEVEGVVFESVEDEPDPGDD
jgi:hypothetical protein